ncbi:aspartyl-phosphate phosphatase Spo0E family protein [Halobacillus litoralis]|uniref:aspartyl-phosphate phosphatase Spo0E family protein n=1 Tax=Halobacillus litoralis TaxID=45668 RepID=UPI001CD2A5F9|nr:aspartyl-phosphate phosphatase Spo0E family protein [Halobacillus litoralis]MCA0972399.1 aspartyl-phosphate phosphatase Spo0E family protein [Halobacillus litoralis]
MHGETSLLEEIETCRDQMSQVALENSLSSQEVLQVSRKLDALMNQYDSMTHKPHQL